MSRNAGRSPDSSRESRSSRSSRGGLDARIALRRGTLRLDIELRIEAGTTAALLGPNGAGKSTTLDAIAGLCALDPVAPSADCGDQGRDHDHDHDRDERLGIVLDGRVLDDPIADVFVPPADRRIGIVFQEPLLFEQMSVLENVAFGPRSRGQARRVARRTAASWLDALELSDLAERRPTALSGGQAQRVAVARALASEPDLLLFDEPLAALDVGIRQQLRRLLRRHLDGFDGPRLLITHDPTDAFLLADRIHVLEQGTITQVGTPAEIRRHPATPYVAALAGTNLFAGVAADGVVDVDDHDHTLTIADTSLTGAVLATIHPRTVSLHRAAPEGSQRNVWPTTVELIEPLGDTVRVSVGAPLPLAVDVTPGAVAALELSPGTTIWAAVKATEITATPA